MPDALNQIGFASLPGESDPRGVCGTCRFFVDDPREVEQELRFLSGATGVTLQTSERLEDDQGLHRFGEAVARTTTHYRSMDAAILHRTHADPSAFGLCEKCVDGAALVHRDCGKEANVAGQRINQCSVWQAMSRVQMLFGRKTQRAKDWRERMERARVLHLSAKPTFVMQECPWHPGRNFKLCCGRTR